MLAQLAHHWFLARPVAYQASAMRNDKIQITPLFRQASSNSSMTSARDRFAVVKRTRAEAPRVKTGCTTCKIRRVKCDEKKPDCLRCTSTGRKCAGYMQPTRVVADHGCTTPQLLLKSLDIYSGNTQEELRALQFFHSKTAPQLSSFFDADFWTRLVFQASHTEDAVRHAMIALGSLAEQRGHGLTNTRRVRAVIAKEYKQPVDHSRHSICQCSHVMPPKATHHGDTFALIHYNKAIAALKSRMLTSNMTTETALLACILFVCIEFFRGEIEPALKHFCSGLNITLSGLGALPEIEHNILPFFSRLELLVSMFGIEVDWEYAVQISRAVPSEFTTMKQARDSLIHLMNLCKRYIRSMKHAKYFENPAEIIPIDLPRQAELLEQFKNWERTLKRFTDTTKKRLTAFDLAGAKVLRLHMLISQIWTSTAPYREESKLDEFFGQFQEAIDIAETIEGMKGIASPPAEQYEATAPSTFLFDMEVVSPVYYIGMNCRHPILRRKAIAVLKHTRRREGLWDSHRAAAVAKRIMLIEEVDLTRFDGSELPAEKARLHDANTRSEPGMFPTRFQLTFHAKPDGLFGNWKIWQEEIVLEMTDD